ncbi:MAG: DUF2344 domain-containing protein [Clostridia bacterium]|nr:DUF2344 domain-containing protein [Clostridia bacterium]
MEQLYLMHFRKTGNARFLSHLDLARLFVRAFRRARLPLKFSEGFHAHPKVRFSPPLSVGVESLCEECVFTLIDEVRTTDELIGAIREGMADGFDVIDLSPIEKKPESAPFARYEITFPVGVQTLRDALTAPMTVTKKTKSGEKEIDIFPHLTFEDVREADGGATLTVLAPSGEALTVNPTLICTALKAKQATLIPARILKVAAVTQ